MLTEQLLSDGFEIWILRFQSGADPQQKQAAVWASSRIDGEAVLRREMTGREAVRLTEALPLHQLEAARHQYNGKASGWLLPDDLHWQVSPQTPFYLLAGAGDDPGVRAHSVAALPFAGPLDDQLGAWPQRNLPADLELVLFPGDGQYCHAILDGAVVPGLVDQMAALDLDHECLYQGALAENSGDLAPWIVTLTPDAALTRRLFTSSDQPSSLWDLDYGCFVVTHHSLAETRAHFRKFTSVETEAGKRVFLRFWSAPVLSAMARHRHHHPLIDSFLAPGRVIFRDFARMDAPRIYALTREEAA